MKLNIKALLISLGISCLALSAYAGPTYTVTNHTECFCVSNGSNTPNCKKTSGVPVYFFDGDAPGKTSSAQLAPNTSGPVPEDTSVTSPQVDSALQSTDSGTNVIENTPPEPFAIRYQESGGQVDALLVPAAAINVSTCQANPSLLASLNSK
jgi:hypothetical protein